MIPVVLGLRVKKVFWPRRVNFKLGGTTVELQLKQTSRSREMVPFLLLIMVEQAALLFIVLGRQVRVAVTSRWVN